MLRTKRKAAPFVVTVVALTGAKLGCGSTTEEEACKAAAPFATCSDEGLSCTLDVSCRSGPAVLSLECTNGQFVHAPTACAHQGDECAPHFRCESGSWLNLGIGGNPPAPCALEAPADSSACRPGAGFGADPDTCGYPCTDGPGWMIVGCSSGGSTGAWTRSACDLDG